MLETTFTCAGGVARLTEALALGHGVRGHDLGHGSPHVIVGRVEAVDGEVHVDLELAARPDYGLVVPRAVAVPGGVATMGGPDGLLLTGDRPLEIADGAVTASFALRAGEDAAFALHHLPIAPLATGASPTPRSGRDARETAIT